MATRRQQSGVDELVNEIRERLRQFGLEWRSESLRNNVLQLCSVYERTKDLGVSTAASCGLPEGAGGRSAKNRLRAYLVEHVGERLRGAELEVVSGISEYARRVRELRTEEGYQIATGASPDPESGVELSSDEYMLVSETPDQEAARRWHVANRIRKRKISSKKRLLAYLQENVNSIVTTEELAYVARAKEFGRRVRELRTEDGYSVATRFTGRPDLSAGQYVLESSDRRAEPHDRRVSNAVQQAVYERDRNTCRLCAWTRSK